MSQCLVSIVLPARDNAARLARTIDSALAQTHSNLEMVVVDAGTLPDTRHLLRFRYGKDVRVRVIEHSHSCIAAARNAGICEAQGDFIAFMDAGDRWQSWKLELQIAALRHLPEVGMVWTDLDSVDDQGDLEWRHSLRLLYEAYRYFSADDLFAESCRLSDVVPNMDTSLAASRMLWGDISAPLLMGNLIHTSTVLMRRSRWEAVGLFRPELWPGGDEYDFQLRNCQQGSVAFIDVASAACQQGLPEGETNPDIALVTVLNRLRVLEQRLNDRSRPVDLPAWMVQHARSDLHGCVGEQALQARNRVMAREHLLKSLRFNPWQTRTVSLLAYAWIPQFFERSLHACLGPLWKPFQPTSLLRRQIS